MKHPAPTAEVVVANPHHLVELLGVGDEHLVALERAFPDSEISVQGNVLNLRGPDAARLARIFSDLVAHLSEGDGLDAQRVARAIEHHLRAAEPAAANAPVFRTSTGRPIRALTANQQKYCDAVASSTITFAVGPAGTGKSFLAVAQAVKALTSHQVKRIVLTRPAVEAGEHLGFLPGDLAAKVDPYLRPLYDALFELLGPETAQRHLEKGVIEIAPLAFMRGRTLNDSFVILDEAQNTTPEQMKMFLTRIGFHAKAVITGDPTQVDLPTKRSGLSGLEELLGEIEGISFVHLTSHDVSRHPVVARIVEAYDAATSL